MMHTRSVLAAAVGTLLLVACGGPTSGDVGLGLSATTTTSKPTPSTTLAPPTSTSVGGQTQPSIPTTAAPATTAPQSPEDLTGFQTAPFRREHNLLVPPVPTLVGVRTARHAGFDRVVFDFDGALPGAESVRFVDRVTADGSGAPVKVGGNAYLLVRFEEAQAHTESGAATVMPRYAPGLPGVREIVLAGDYEGYVTFALGLGSRVPFRVLELSDPHRVVVDVLAG